MLGITWLTAIGPPGKGRQARHMGSGLALRSLGPLSVICAIAALVCAGSTATPSIRDGANEGSSQGRPNAISQPRVVVLKSRRILHLFDADRLVRTYPIDLGVAPLGPKRKKNDGRTPEGTFHVISKNAGSSYHRFIGLDYPDPTAADWGMDHGLISPGEAGGIRAAWRGRRCPPWNTALGGGIGLHGHRKGRDWTGGCIAVSDGHIDELFAVLRIGDPVEILP